MKRKDASVQANFHWMLSEFLFDVDDVYQRYGDELVITSGGEQDARHGVTSLHYAMPCQAADIRTWSTEHGRAGAVPSPSVQFDDVCAARDAFCRRHNIPPGWVDVILESSHMHIEFQPKRMD